MEIISWPVSILLRSTKGAALNATEFDTNLTNLKNAIDSLQTSITGLTVESTSVINQDLTTDASPTFAGIIASSLKPSGSGSLTLTDHDSKGITVAHGGDVTAYNNLMLGHAEDVDIFIYANNGDTNKPFFKYDSATSKWRFSHDGTVVADFGGTEMIDDTAYAASWDSITTKAPSKNAIYDKIESLSSSISGLVNDTAFAASWDGVTTIAPSKNAVYDKVNSLVSDVAYSASWNDVTDVAPSKNAVYDALQGLGGSADDTAFAASWDGVTTISPSKNAVYDKIIGMISDTAYAASWDGVTDVAPSKNAVYDKMQTLATFSRGGTLVNAVDGLAAMNVVVWIAPYACTVVAVKGYKVGGTNAVINARLNGASNHLSSNLTVSSDSTWTDGGTVQNATYAAGDKLEIMIVSVSGTVTQVSVQVNFTRG